MQVSSRCLASNAGSGIEDNIRHSIGETSDDLQICSNFKRFFNGNSKSAARHRRHASIPAVPRRRSGAGTIARHLCLGQGHRRRHLRLVPFPCRTFKFALGQTSSGGEIKALAPADYGPVTITHSVSITGIEGAGINSVSGDHITINAGANDIVNLSDLTLDGLKTANNGIVLNSGGSLTISYCTVRNFRAAGISLKTPHGRFSRHPRPRLGAQECRTAYL